VSRLRDVAYHEAGHACVALLLGKSYGCAVFGDAAEGGGLAGPGNLSEPADVSEYATDKIGGMHRVSDMKTILNDGAVTAAGVVAVAILKGERRDLVYLRGPDRQVVDEGARGICGDAADLFELRAWHAMAMARAWKLLSDHWQGVERVARELEAKRHLTAVEVAAAMFPNANGAYARQAKDRQLEIDASEIRIRAERRLGQMIAEQKRTVGLNTGTAGAGRPSLGSTQEEPPKDDRPTLADAGIS